MHLVELELPNYRGLRDFHLNLHDARDVGVLVGRNGRGKSRVLHALVEIFGSLRRSKKASFSYGVKYIHGDLAVHVVQKTAGSQPTMKISASGRAAEQVNGAHWHHHLPDHVFGYQASGESVWDEEFERHAKADLDAARKQGMDRLESQPGLRSLFQCDGRHLPLILLALLPDWSERFSRYTEKHVGIQGFASADLTVRRPPWFRNSSHAALPYWGLQGFAPTLFDQVASMGRFGAIPDSSIPSNYDDFRITIAAPDDLASFLGLFASDATMFATLERLQTAEILTADVRLITSSGDQIRPQDLSAGEQQMLVVLGMLRLQRGEESLFLLDEPASHFHPAWSQSWYASIREMLEDGQRSQFIATTHDPALVSNVPREQLRILRRANDGSTCAEMPADDPRGRGVGGILTSELYGLTSQLDSYTQMLIDEQYELAGRRKLSHDELDRLRELNEKLEELGFAPSHREKAVELFLAELDRRRKELISSATGDSYPNSQELAALAAQLFDQRLTRGL
ncbi:AAA family ATPase [Streptomyces sp. WAC06614]|uniref:AAA family ATPase n=1 Tax=Streptomyces sp. WAC06614 TaxID=2487416 RepID=UPI00163BDBE4|nr:AAA family ATPase [Streptomyces sp. WAC06614]